MSSWLAYGAAVYFMAVEAGIIQFAYQPNDIGVISPTTIARIPKIARTFHFVAGTGFSAFTAVSGWWLWLSFCAFLSHHSDRDFQELLPKDALVNVTLLIAFADIVYKFMPYKVAAILGLIILATWRLSIFLYARKKSTIQV